jgi:hypothetical protein
VLNEAEENHNLYNSNNQFSGETTINELSHLFLEAASAVARSNNSALKGSFAKKIPFSCSEAITSYFLC